MTEPGSMLYASGTFWGALPRVTVLRCDEAEHHFVQILAMTWMIKLVKTRHEFQIVKFREVEGSNIMRSVAISPSIHAASCQHCGSPVIISGRRVPRHDSKVSISNGYD